MVWLEERFSELQQQSSGPVPMVRTGQGSLRLLHAQEKAHLDPGCPQALFCKAVFQKRDGGIMYPYIPFVR